MYLGSTWAILQQGLFIFDSAVRPELVERPAVHGSTGSPRTDSTVTSENEKALHPSEDELKPLEEVLLPGITEEELKSIEETVVPGVSEDEIKAITEKFTPGKSDFEEINFSPTLYQRDATLPPGMVLYGTHDNGFKRPVGKPGKGFWYGPGNGLQLIVRFSHCEGDEAKFFVLPCPLLIFRPRTGVEIPLVETDAKGVGLHDSKTITVYRTFNGLAPNEVLLSRRTGG